MRVLEIGEHRFTEVVVLGEPNERGEYNKYYIGRAGAPGHEPAGEFGHVKFQEGPVAEVGVNGCFQEDLIAICIDRLRSFQSSDLKCRENALALTKLEEALHWLDHRTKNRQRRGVEGSLEK